LLDLWLMALALVLMIFSFINGVIAGISGKEEMGFIGLGMMGIAIAIVLYEALKIRRKG